MQLFSEYSDSRLAALYDTVNPCGADTAFYVDLATQVSAATILDIGCGTGLLACALARRGHRVIGVEPARAMLDVARRRPGGDQVSWIEGDARQLDGIDDVKADLAIMTGHVAQLIPDDQMWRATLRAIYRIVRPSGRVAFESRNPAGRPWERWTPEASRRRVEDPVRGPVEVWQRLIEAREGRARFEYHYQLLASGEHLVSTNELRFPSPADLTRSLTDAGFAVEHIFGDWDRHPMSDESPEFIFVAVRGEPAR